MPSWRITNYNRARPPAISTASPPPTGPKTAAPAVDTGLPVDAVGIGEAVAIGVVAKLVKVGEVVA